MNKSSLRLLTGVLAGFLAVGSARAAVTVQSPTNTVGTGATAWSYLVLEGEDFESEVNADPGVGFTRVGATEDVTDFHGTPVLGTNTTASKKGALYAESPAFGLHADKVTYQVVFDKPGTYYLYMRFTMFERNGNDNYLSEDSFFLPPGLNKDPQNDWPLTDPANGRNGGYTEGCCNAAGFLFIPELADPTDRISHSGDTNYFEGNFHWNQLFASQFLASGVSGEPGTPEKIEVTQADVGKTNTFTVSYREAGLAVDLFLFSTHTNLLAQYTQAELDQLLVPPGENVTVQDPGNVVGTGADAWSFLVLEGEDYDSEVNADPGVGFTRVGATEDVTDFHGTPVLGTNTTASKKGALYAESPAFGLHADKVTYQVQFNRPGTYYLYMRFTMFERNGNDNYLSEDSFFLPPALNKDPQNDWPLTDPANGRNGGYTEGCCNAAGFLFIPEVADPTDRISHSGDTNYFEGNFHWNQLFASQFLASGVSGEPGAPEKIEVTQADVGKTANFTVSYREAGLAVDLFLFSTHTNLLAQYTQEQLDQLLLKPSDNVTVQDTNNVVGSGANAWSFMVLEGEDYDSEVNADPGVGFTRVGATDAVTDFHGTPVLGTNTTASKKGALYAESPAFGLHADKVTYQVQFTRPGTYYLYMRFTMFERNGNDNYLSEDSFFLPPGLNKDPQNDWPLTDPANGRNGGYTEGCCNAAGFLFIPELADPTDRISHSGDTNYFEGNFHWNQLFASQFLASGVSGEPGAPQKIEVTQADVGKTADFTVSYREAGLAVDLFLFSTHTNLLAQYTQEELDQLILGGGGTPTTGPQLSISRSGNNVTLSWPTSATGFILESSPTLSPATWTAVTSPAIVVSGNQNTVTVDASTGTRFYRLRKP